MNDMTITTPNSLPAIMSRALNALTSAKTYAEQEEALIKANLTFDKLEAAKKLYKDMEIELSKAQAELIVAIDRARSNQRQLYIQAVKNGEMAPHGGARTRTEKLKVRTSDLENFQNSTVSSAATLPTTSKVGLSKQRLHETKKIDEFDEANPGVREAIIRAMPEKGERITKGISLKIATSKEKENKQAEQKAKDEAKQKKAMEEQARAVAELERRKKKMEELCVKDKQDSAAFNAKKATDEAAGKAYLYRDNKPPLTLDEWKFLLTCLHPDARPAADKLTKAYAIISGKKFDLTGVK